MLELIISILILVAISFLVIIAGVYTSVIIASRIDKKYMTSYEKCNGNCEACRDKEQCMNRPYN